MLVSSDDANARVEAGQQRRRGRMADRRRRQVQRFTCQLAARQARIAVCRTFESRHCQNNLLSKTKKNHPLLKDRHLGGAASPVGRRQWARVASSVAAGTDRYSPINHVATVPIICK